MEAESQSPKATNVETKPKLHSDDQEYKLRAENIDVFYDDFQAIKNVSLNIVGNSITAFIGPSGCGKSTFLRLFNRMNDYIDGFSMNGDIYMEGKDIYDPSIKVEELRKTVGMVFQKPNPFPKSIYENVAYGLRIQGISDEDYIEERVVESLKQATLFEEIKDNLDKQATALSGGQQQRLCIARALAVKPSVLLMDEPTSALDPISSGKIEDLVHELKSDYTIVIVTHNMQQAGRVSDNTAFLYMGSLIEYGDTQKIFTNPEKDRTQNYITGRFG
ncbi:phosphate ABC transporter ATP-binding protein, PhoT family [Fodinibius salinus]|uniref:Phosphate ABC transporter ATP-binding protein, PhoT family n=1 Tax=Fodinibius salinus TaxID=860790 RepID=A0A5D3YN97_9BACT|nr:phosphate ABC transporter ATP-binding protein PstB [Fodinibius salinus]TYP95257.1 phosphate ABC transporter ATP-binding protein, PhoT family [Fodinibius salinus]